LSMIIEKAERNPSASDVLAIARAARLPNSAIHSPETPEQATASTGTGEQGKGEAG